MEIILKYFPDLTQKQIEQFAALQKIYKEWNEQINVISRKDIDNLYLHHVLHSLAIAKFVSLRGASKVLDLGTGGGFPGIPLAILFPDCRFHLVDSIGKKLKVVEAVKDSIALKNVFTFHSRVEDMDFQYDFVVSRAVAPLADLVTWTKRKYLHKDLNTLHNGLICLKGGDIDAELATVKNAKKIPISNYFNEPFFGDKFLVYSEQ
ncbi:MAG: rRNA small subunit methyltransferase, glucose inhibited division protein GidB [Bacteroidota bacterium]|nr:rRNA small subunit methyltransferase, glucose inhibited division protein GidB [Bacteroidota bacterium]